jgi:hypothetical protein
MCHKGEEDNAKMSWGVRSSISAGHIMTTVFAVDHSLAIQSPTERNHHHLHSMTPGLKFGCSGARHIILVNGSGTSILGEEGDHSEAFNSGNS